MADLSDIGLKGLNSYAQRTLMAAQAEQLQSSAAKDNFEIAVAKRTQEVAEQAARALHDTETEIGTVDEKSRKLQSLADPLSNVGMVFMRAGLTEQGAKYLDKASEVRRREVQNVSDEVTAQKNRLENIQKGAEVVSTYLGRAKNQAEWEFGLAEVEKVLPEEAKQFREMNGGEFHPDVAAFLFEKAISAKDQARLDMDVIEEQGRQSRHQATISNEDERIALQRARDRDLNNYRERLLKVSGGKTSSQVAPTDDAVRESRSALISGGYFKKPANGKTDAELEDAAAFIANETNKILKDIPGLDRNAAIQRAIMRADAKGKFTTEGKDTPSVFGFGGSTSTRKFNRYAGDVGKTQDAPAKLPPKGQKLGKGLWYNLPDGSVGQFDGEGFIVP